MSRQECLESIVAVGFGGMEVEVVFALSCSILGYGCEEDHDISQEGGYIYGITGQSRSLFLARGSVLVRRCVLWKILEDEEQLDLMTFGV